MSIKHLISLLLYLGSYSIPSYLLLKKLGVGVNVWGRAFQFGSVLGSLQIILPVAILYLGLTLFESFQGATVGSILGLVLSYIYVSKVLVVRWYQNIAIVFLLPIVASFIAAPLLYLYYGVVA